MTERHNMNERHDIIIRELFDRNNLEVTFASHATRVNIKYSESKELTGILVGKSIAIPVSTPKNSDLTLMEIAANNLRSLESISSDPPVILACRALSLPFGTETKGIFADGRGFNQVGALHLHPGNHSVSQQEFVSNLVTILEERKITVSLSEFV